MNESSHLMLRNSNFEVFIRKCFALLLIVFYLLQAVLEFVAANFEITLMFFYFQLSFLVKSF